MASDSMLSTQNAVEQIFLERQDFIIIGLTGRTGCGCTTVANLLCKDFEHLQPPEDNRIETYSDRQNKIIYEFAKENWIAFRLIEMKHIIFTFIIENDFEHLITFIDKHIDEDKDVKEKVEQFKEEYMTFNDKVNKWKEKIIHRKFDNCIEQASNVNELDTANEIYNFYFCEIPKFYEKLKDCFSPAVFKKFLQITGENIRSSGEAFSSDFNPDNIFALSRRVNLLVKLLRRINLGQEEHERQKILLVIDAFRNPYEVSFFKDRYAAFYLFAINTPDDSRKKRLIKLGLTHDDIEALDAKEFPKSNNDACDFYKINIEKTVEIADVHINNPDSKSMGLSETKRQIIRYVSLIMHPGMVSPTDIERCMQIAYDSKLTSGCLSRQVGAVISDNEYNIISTGWNCAPKNQIPCNLRSLYSIINDGLEDAKGMSEFEQTNPEYKNFLKQKTGEIDFSSLKGLNCSYCFKDAYNGYKQQKNQVHTRSIHAEEMAFLQASKLGSISMKGGFLFTTASPCELCSKKACHVGISKIYFIDQYPGISYEHILNCGEQFPEMIHFHGAIGSAYTKLYSQIIPYKDELYMRLGLSFNRTSNFNEGTQPTEEHIKHHRTFEKLGERQESEGDGGTAQGEDGETPLCPAFTETGNL